LGIIPHHTFDKPQSTIAELTVIGSGGYGESCVIHLGNDEWIVVDSCYDPKLGNCLPLLYLKEIGVDVKNSVKAVVCTHWHDDHIKGISQLYAEAENSIFCIADVIDLKKFLRLVRLDFTKYKGKTISNASTVEFNKCVDISE
jgi:glyoxylase-like metal-dependent hydrolase (beta-lactamase superfamily II)